MNGRFQGKVAIITGAGRGIGRGIAARFGQEGAAVCVNYARSRDGALAAVDDIEKAGGRAFAFQADVGQAGQVQAMVDETVRRYGRVDIVVANAANDDRHDFLEMKEDDWDLVMDTNVKGTFLVCQAGAREMARVGGGKIVIITSIHHQGAFPKMVAYATSKGAQLSLTRALGLELAHLNINVNCVAVGRTMVEKNFTRIPSFDPHMYDDVIPVGRIGQPADQAAVVAFLCSEEAGFMTGSVVTVDGGLSSINYFQAAINGPVWRKR